MKRVATDDLDVEPKVRDFIRCGYRTEDDVNIVEDHGGSCPTFDNGVESEYL